MPSKSKKQRDFVFSLRDKYKTVDKTPKKYKWVWNKDWEKIEPKSKKNENTVKLRKAIKTLVTEELSKINESYNDLDYHSKVKIDFDYSGVTYKNLEVENVFVSDITLYYNIDLYHSSYGITRANVLYIEGPKTIDIEIEYNDGKDDYVELYIDWDDAELENDANIDWLGIDSNISIKLKNNNNGDIIVDKITISYRGI